LFCLLIHVSLTLISSVTSLFICSYYFISMSLNNFSGGGKYGVLISFSSNLSYFLLKKVYPVEIFEPRVSFQ
jgi:hypothetical protein